VGIHHRLSPKQIRLKILQAQIGRLERHNTRLQAIGDRLSWLRLAVFVVGTVLSVVGLFQFGKWAFGVGETLTLVVFFALVRSHRQVTTLNRTLYAWADVKRTHIARMTLNWPVIPRPDGIDVHSTHPFALDLDIVGDCSLLRLVNTAVTHEGTLRLCGWMIDTRPDVDIIRQREALVSELKEMRHFRDKLTIRATLVAQGHVRNRLTWLNSAAPPSLLPTVGGTGVGRDLWALRTDLNFGPGSSVRRV